MCSSCISLHVVCVKSGIMVGMYMYVILWVFLYGKPWLSEHSRTIGLCRSEFCQMVHSSGTCVHIVHVCVCMYINM